MVGNGVTNWRYDGDPAYIEMGYWHSLYDTELYDKIKAANCNYEYLDAGNTDFSDECISYLEELYALVEDVNIYDIYGTCWGLGNSPQLYSSRTSQRAVTAADYTPWLFKHTKNGEQHRLRGLPPCTFGNPIIDYLNQADVRAKLHVPTDIQYWDLCKDDIDYTVSLEASQWIYEKLYGKYRMLKFSGDTDGAVPTWGT